MSRCIAILLALLAPAALAVPLEEATVAELQEAMKSGKETAASIARAYLDRIKKRDGKIRSVIEVNPDALAIAKKLDEERKSKGPRGPLHGIPILIKDNIATADKMQTTAGSLALVGVKPPRDAFVVSRLRAAGAVILGKTNLSEWANIRSPKSSSGWSARGGLTRNPYSLDHTACGSSSGTGAAIASSFAAVGVGTETDGSILCPSAVQSLVGIKPTVGLVSRSGIIPISHSQDTAGPMARTVADAAALLGAMAGADPKDAATQDAKGARDYTKLLDAGALKGARIGIARKKLSSPATDRALAAAIEAMKARGAVIVDPADIPHAEDYGDDETEVLLSEFKVGLAEYLAEWAPGAPVKSLADLIAFNRKHAAKEMPHFGQERFELAQKKGPLDGKAYLDAKRRARTLSRDKGLHAVIARHKLDALVAPTMGLPWKIDLKQGDRFPFSSTSPAAVAGTPAITVPAGYEGGLPMGITFMGRAWSEGVLIRLAYAYEQATKHRKPPKLP